jgi:hypothetical protein
VTGTNGPPRQLDSFGAARSRDVTQSAGLARLRQLQRTEQSNPGDQPHHSEHGCRTSGLNQGDIYQRGPSPIFSRGDDLVIGLDQRGRYSNPAFRACIVRSSSGVAGS